MSVWLNSRTIALPFLLLLVTRTSQKGFVKYGIARGAVRWGNSGERLAASPFR
jgi:hypothetical protein